MKRISIRNLSVLPSVHAASAWAKSRITPFIWVPALLLIPTLAVAQKQQRDSHPPPQQQRVSHPPPQPRNSNPPQQQQSNSNPPPQQQRVSNPPQQRPSNTQPAPQPSSNQPSTPSAGNGSAKPSSPSNSLPSYTPGSPSGGETQRTYTPGGISNPQHTYTPGASSKEGPSTHSVGTSTASPEGVKSANGVTTSTPKAPGGYTTTTEGTANAASNSSRSASPARASRESNPVYSIPASSEAGKSASGTSGSSKLTPTGSQSVLRQVNSARAGLTGINRTSIPQGNVAVHPDGKLTVTTANGRNFGLRPNGTLASFKAPNTSATFRGNGRLASLHTPSMDINRGSRGERTIVTERPDHSRLVSTGRHTGYLERPIVFHDHSYVQRTYVTGGHVVSRVFTAYSYNGLAMDHFVPAYSYAPAFYGWAYYPWSAPTMYSWGWGGSPWFAAYGGYFSPATAYPSGANWLTDYYLSQTLAARYDAQAQPDDGQQAGAGAIDSSAPDADAQGADDDASATVDTPISPDVKQALVQTIKQQISYENAASTRPDQAATLTDLPQVMTSNHLFVVDQGLNVSAADGQQCGLSVGDLLQLGAAPPDGSTAADLTVVSSFKGDCAATLQVSVNLTDLEDMQTNLRAQLDAGLKLLHDLQGQGGLPAAPHSAIGPPPRPADDPPPDGDNVQALLDTQQQQANQAEASVTQTAFAEPQPQ